MLSPSINLVPCSFDLDLTFMSTTSITLSPPSAPAIHLDPESHFTSDNCSITPQAFSLLDDLYIGSIQSFEGITQQPQGISPKNMYNMSGMQQGGYPTNILEPVPLQSQLPQCQFLYTQNQHPQCQPPQSSYSAPKHTFGVVPILTSDTSPMSQHQSGGRIGTTPIEPANLNDSANAAPTPAPRNCNIIALGNNLTFDPVYLESLNTSIMVPLAASALLNISSHHSLADLDILSKNPQPMGSGVMGTSSTNVVNVPFQSYGMVQQTYGTAPKQTYGTSPMSQSQPLQFQFTHIQSQSPQCQTSLSQIQSPPSQLPQSQPPMPRNQPPTFQSQSPQFQSKQRHKHRSRSQKRFKIYKDKSFKKAANTGSSVS